MAATHEILKKSLFHDTRGWQDGKTDGDRFQSVRDIEKFWTQVNRSKSNNESDGERDRGDLC